MGGSGFYQLRSLFLRYFLFSACVLISKEEDGLKQKTQTFTSQSLWVFSIKIDFYVIYIENMIFFGGGVYRKYDLGGGVTGLKLDKT